MQFAARVAVEPEDVLDRVEARKLDRTQQLALIAAREAWADAGTPDVDRERLGVSIATGIGGALTLLGQWDILRESGPRRVSPHTIPMLMPNGPAAVVGLEITARAGVHTPVSACASGAEAVAQGLADDSQRTRRRRHRRRHRGLHPPAAARCLRGDAGALQAQRRPGGSVASVGHRPRRLRLRRGRRRRSSSRPPSTPRPAAPRSTPRSPARASPPTDTTSPSPTRRARAPPARCGWPSSDAGAEASDVVHINAHATSTPQGDVAEALAIRAALGDDAASQVAVTSTKSMTGHLLGAAGAVESMASCHGAARPLVPPTINLDNLDPDGAARHRRRPGAQAGRRPLPRCRRLEQLVRVRRAQRGPGVPELLVTTTDPATATDAPHGHASQEAEGSPRPRPAEPEQAAARALRRRHLRRAHRRRRLGMLAGHGLVNGTHAVAFASDATVMGGAMGAEGCKVILAAYARALADEIPVIGLWHSGGARLAEGVVSLHAVGEVFNIMTRASGRIPQISVVLGAAAGGAAYGPALTDIVILGPNGRVFVTGPDVVRSVTGEDVNMERLGGAEPHARRSGVVHIATETDEDALDQGARARRTCSARRVSSRRPPLSTTSTSPSYLPESAKRAYDVHPLVEHLLDAEHVRRAARALGAQHRHHPRTPRRPHRRRHRQQPTAARRLPRLSVR